jgi:prepilin signal peptidase PulO-like enzyme (type II secretory pathway)
MNPTEQILGVHFFNGTVDEAVDAMCANGGLLVVPAAPALVKLSEDEGYRRALTSADMVIADSGAMVLLWKIFTGRRVERISGLKFLKRLVTRLASHPDERVLWIVPSEHAHEKTIAWLRSMNLTATADFYIAPRYAAQVRDDALVAKIDNPEIIGARESIRSRAYKNAVLEFHYNRVRVGADEFVLDTVDQISGVAHELEIPREAMGRGDLKFLAAIGAFLGWRGVLFSIFAGSVVGSIVGLATLVIGKRVWSAKLPFGPYLAFGALTWMFFGEKFVRWYVQLVNPV